MKKLTKTLSLVLVVAMVLGLCVIGAGASYSSFTDKDKITKDYTEAVEVMTDLNCVTGMNATTFAPAGTFTRAQAAVILTRLTMGANTDTLTPSSVTFKDVPASFWGYKYIEYAVKAGYVAGTGNNMYSPNATLTGYQWAAMLMKVLGISAANAGTDWQINTAKAYYAADTAFSNVAISSAPITREAATQMAYDALFNSTNATTGYPVYYQAGATAASTDKIVSYYDTMAEAMSGAAMYNALKNAAAGTANSYYAGTTAKTIKEGTSLASTVFGVSRDSGNDVFGRPSTVYTAKTVALGNTYGWTNATKTVANTPVVTYTLATKAATVLSDLAGYYSAAGVKVDATYAATVAGLTANGKVVAVYANSSKVVAPVEITYTVGTVTDITTATDKTVTYTITNADGTLVVKDFPDSSNSVDTVSLQGTVAKGDVVTYVTKTVSGTDVTFVYPTTKVTGAQTSFSTANGTVNVGGKDYVVATGVKTGAATYVAVPANSANANNVYYLDQFGYVVKSTSAAAFGTYAYVVNALGKVDATLTGNTPTLSVLAVLQDGTVGQYTVNLYKNTSGTYYLNSNMQTEVYSGTGDFNNATVKAALVSGVFGYSVSGTAISLQELTAGVATANVVKDTVYSYTTATNAIKTGTTAVATSAGATALMNSSTVFVSYNSTKGTAVVYTGNTAIPSTVTIPVGAKMVAAGNAAAGTVGAKVVFSASATDTAAVVKNYIFIDTTKFVESIDGSDTYYTYTGLAADSTTVTVKAKNVQLSGNGLYTYNADNSIATTNAVYTYVSSAWAVRNSADATFFMNGTATVTGSLISVAAGTYYNVTSDTKTVYIDSTKTSVNGNSVVLVLAANSDGTASSNVATIYVVG